MKVLEKRYGMLSPEDKSGYKEFDELLNKLEVGELN